MASDEFLSLRKVSLRLNVPERTLRHWARTNVIGAVKVGRKQWFIRESDLSRSERRLHRPPKGGTA
jgi:excisionase family DNA binding protein